MAYQTVAEASLEAVLRRLAVLRRMADHVGKRYVIVAVHPVTILWVVQRLRFQ